MCDPLEDRISKDSSALHTMCLFRRLRLESNFASGVVAFGLRITRSSRGQMFVLPGTGLRLVSIGVP